MTSGDRRVVLDASAVLAWLLRESGAETVRRLLPVAVLPASAMTESLYRARERGHRLSLQELFLSIREMGVDVEAITAADSVRAAELIETSRRSKRRRSDPSLSLGDGLCIAVAERLQLPVVGGDSHWETLVLTVAFRP